MPFAIGTFTPAIFRRAFFVVATCVTLLVATQAANVPVKPPELSQMGKADPEEAARILEQFRRSGIPGQYYLEFELHALPRRGEEQIFQGRLWGGRNEQGAISRVELTDAKNQKHRLLIQNGEHAAVWKFTQGKVAALSVAELFQPLIPGVEVTAFDVQMPFLYWPDATLEKITRMRGRPSNAFLFRAPASFTQQHAEVTAARAYLDTQFNALMQTELLGANDRVVKTTSLLDLKKITDPVTRREQWIPKAFDVRNETTRDKTRFVIKAVALDLELAPAVFQPASLAEEIAPPARGLVRIDG